MQDAANPQPSRSGFAIFSIVLAVVAVLTLPTWFAPLIAGAGVVLGIVAQRRRERRWFVRGAIALNALVIATFAMLALFPNPS